VHAPPTRAANLVATSQLLAAEAGIAILRRGGNAIDAALASAIALTVVEPTSNGIGGDAFALIWKGGRLHGYNGSGRSPRGWTVERFAGRAVPMYGWESVTVPGAVAAWSDCHERFGSLPFAALFADAIRHAEEGFPLGAVTAGYWEAGGEIHRDHPGFADCFLPGGRVPRTGEVVRLPDHAATLRAIAESGGEAFYRGELARAIAADAARHGAALDLEDLSAHRGDWVASLSVASCGVRLHELPPNTQGPAALIAAGIADYLHLGDDPDDPAAIHLQIEAAKLALADARARIADPAHVDGDPERWHTPERCAALARRIDPERAADLAPGPLPLGGTVLLTTADAAGDAVCFIQSNFRGFGSGVVVPGTGIALQDRGHGFAPNPAHPNAVGPSKRPFHTLVPGFITSVDGEEAIGPFGCMGGEIQAQGHLQLLLRTRRWGQDPQTAIDAPRWFLQEDGEVWLEAAAPGSWERDLARRGHRVARRDATALFGGAQMILRDGDAWLGGSDQRKDGKASGF